MKDAFVVVFTSILFFACTGPTVAQEIELIPELKNWEPVIGKWNHESETRESPTAEWKKGSETWEFFSGGFFLDIRGTSEIAGQRTSWIEVTGYDPVRKTCISSFFISDGSRGGVTSMDWDGTTLNVNFDLITAEREVQVMRNTWEYASDYKSLTLTTETFTGGQWWVSAKVKGTKVN